VAILYQAELTPSKMEMLSTWVPVQAWLGDADVRTLDAVGSYRFDDPGGEVGVETHLLRSADGQVLQVPLTYRSAPMGGGEPSLITTAHCPRRAMDLRRLRRPGVRACARDGHPDWRHPG
jgi:hypothetical protein